MPPELHQHADDEYEVRAFEPSDRFAFLDLYEAVWGRRRSPQWFHWRFERAPYADGVPMVVVEGDDGLVGAEPCLAFRVGAGGVSSLAYQPADWIVHPDHRRQGVFTRMTERLLADPPGGRPRLYFNFPNDELLPGLQRFDWRVAGSLTTEFRVQRASSLLAARSPFPRSAGRIADVATRGYCRLSDARRQTPDVTVERHDGVPAASLARLYRRDIPDVVHVVRDRQFYAWRFANPRWETTTYTVRRDGQLVASLVACTEQEDGVRVTSLLDALPLTDGDSDVAAALVAAAIEDNADADVVRAGPAGLPTDALRANGFRPDDSLPLSPFSEHTTLATRPGNVDDPDAWRLRGHRLDAVEDWQLSLGDRDVA